MADVAKKHQDQLERIKDNVKDSYEWFYSNYDRFTKSRNFIFKSTLNERQRSVLQELRKPELEFNVLEAFISRLLGEFSKQEPYVEITTENEMLLNPQIMDQIITLLEGHLKYIFDTSNKKGCAYQIYKDILSGGFSVAEVFVDYENENSFTKQIFFERVFDPLLCGFDPLAKLPSKADGNFCYKLYPKTIEEFQTEYPGINVDELNFTREIGIDENFAFSWSYRNERSKKILLICDYYEKKYRKKKIVKLSNGMTMNAEDYEDFITKWQTSGNIAQPPVVTKERMTKDAAICRYRFIGNKVIEYVETDYKYLPLIFFAGNTEHLRSSLNGKYEQLTRPYFYQAIGAQHLRDMCGQTLAHEIENLTQQKWKAAIEGIPIEYKEAYTNNQLPNVLIYNAYKENDPNKPLPPPQEIARPEIPATVTNTFQMTDKMMQTTLGSYDASLGINNNQLSGIAIVEAATQSNAAAMPFIVGYMQSLTQVAQIILNLIPKYYVTPRTFPYIDRDGKRKTIVINQGGQQTFNYPSSMLNVNIEAGVNFSIQKSKALNQLIALIQALPEFAQFLQSTGMEVILDNLEIKGLDHLKLLYEQWQQQQQQMQQQMMQQQQQQPNPLVMRNQIDQQRIAMEGRQNEEENKLKAAELMLNQSQQQTERARLLSELEQSRAGAAVELRKDSTERAGRMVDLAIKAMDKKDTIKEK